MQLIMGRTKKNGRRAFLGSLAYPSGGLVLDRDFDNDNGKPVTAECLGDRTIRLSH